MDLTNPLVYGGPAFIAFILLELVYSKTHDNDKLYEWKDLFASGAMGIGSAIIAPLVKIISLVCAPICLAIVLLASSIALRRWRPCACVEEGFPKDSNKKGVMASNTAGSIGVDAA